MLLLTHACRQRQHAGHVAGLYLSSRSIDLLLAWTLHVQEARGVKVSSRMFAGSPHVAHYRQYPANYEAELDRFMASVPQAAPAA